MIKRKINKPIAICFAFLLLLNALSAQVISPFNKRLISDSSKNYSFIVSGHFHGASSNASTFPASTLLANIDVLNSIKPSFLMSLGDLFLDVNETYLNHYQVCLFDKLKMPLFNAVGNHDLANGNMYEKVYGKTFFSFIDQSELFIVLNTELNDGSIKGEQLELLKSSLNKAKEGTIKNVFIFSHRPVWAEENPKYSNLFKGNTRSQFGSSNFEKEIRPLLEASSKAIYWISGSMADGPASFFYDKEPNSSITFMQTAIRDLPRDAVLEVIVLNGKILLQGISLTGKGLEPVENYNVQYWTKNTVPEEPFNYRLLPYLTLQMLKHHFFWIGFISGGCILSCFIALKKRVSKKKN